jgi:hypothetical protein
MNISDMFDEVSEQGRLGKSDHVMIFSKISGGGTEEDLKSTPDWRRADWDTMRAVLREEAWLRQLRSLDARTAWAAVRNKVTELVEQHVPNRRLRNQNRPAWLSQEILRAIRRKKRLWKLCKGMQPTEEYRAAEKRSKIESAMQREISKKNWQLEDKSDHSTPMSRRKRRADQQWDR